MSTTPATANTTATTGRGKAVHITLWVLQILMGSFFIVASAAPKLVGQQVMVDMFDDIGIGQWFRLLVGALELAGGIGLLIPRLAGLAAIGLAGLMIGAGFTQVVVLDAPAMVTSPVIFFVVFVLIAWGRWPRTKALLGR